MVPRQAEGTATKEIHAVFYEPRDYDPRDKEITTHAREVIEQLTLQAVKVAAGRLKDRRNRGSGLVYVAMKMQPRRHPLSIHSFWTMVNRKIGDPIYTRRVEVNVQNRADANSIYGAAKAVALDMVTEAVQQECAELMRRNKITGIELRLTIYLSTG